MILRARLVLPITRPPIENGAVEITGRRIRAVGRWRDLAPGIRGRAVDLGEVVLLPGLINAHCHLDYTRMAGQFPPPKVFIDWLQLITSTKADWTAADYARSWLIGARMLLRTGTTTVGDIEAVPRLLPDLWNATPLRVLSFLEMIGITGRRTPVAILQEAVEKIVSLGHPRCWAGLSPHAPYSTVSELLQLTAREARSRNWLLCTHAAESAPEFAMFTEGRGVMFDWLRRSGRDMSDCGLGSPVQHLDQCGVLNHNLLAIHVNYLARGDAVLLGKRGVHVVHCPRSHAYFRHDPFPLHRLQRAGVNICLGTDSLASVYKARRQVVELDMFEEMRVLSDRNPWLSSRAILQMATFNGAGALGRRSQIGELSPRTLADLIAVRALAKSSRTWDAVLGHRGPVAASMIDGRWAIPPQ